MTESTNTGFYSIYQIIGHKKRGIPPIIPVSRSTFLKGIDEGLFPKPVYLSPKTKRWLHSEIKAYVANGGMPTAAKDGAQ